MANYHIRINMHIQYPQIASPAYVLEEKLLLNNLSLLEKVQKEAGVEIICALKGFSFYHVFGTIKKYLSGATASSLNEARLAYEEMGEKCHAYTPAYIASEFNEFMNYASHMTFNS